MCSIGCVQHTSSAALEGWRPVGLCSALRPWRVDGRGRSVERSESMTSDQIASLLEIAEAKKGEAGWLELGLHHLTLHAAYNGASLSLARLEAIKMVGPMVHARGPRG